MVSNLPIQLLLVQLSNMYINPQNYNINLTAPNNNTKIGVIHFTKDQMLDAKKIQDLETEKHKLSTKLNMAKAENQRLRHEQIRNRVRKALLRNATFLYISTKKELDAKIERLAQVETMLNNTEKVLNQVKQESELWHQKCERYENIIFEVVEGGQLGKKAAKLKSKETEAQTSKEGCTAGSCEEQNGRKECPEEKKWCCWLENVTASNQDNEVEVTKTENDEKKCKELSLVEASKMNNVTIISELLEDDTNVHTSFTKTPLHWATENGHLEACSLLLRNGANINARDSDDFDTTPVHIAAELGHIPILEFFLKDKHTDIDAKDVDGCTSLHWAVTFNQADAVLILLNNNASVNITDNDGESPLHHAVLNGNLQIVKALLLYGADANAVDNEGRTPLHFATLSNYVNITSNDTTSVLYPVPNDTAIVNDPCKILHRYMTSFKIRNKFYHFTKLNHSSHSLHNSVPAKVFASCLAKHDCTEITMKLLEAGANPFAEDKRGVTPFEGASPECTEFMKSRIDLQKQVYTS